MSAGVIFPLKFIDHLGQSSADHYCQSDKLLASNPSECVLHKHTTNSLAIYSQSVAPVTFSKTLPEVAHCLGTRCVTESLAGTVYVSSLS